MKHKKQLLYIILLVACMVLLFTMPVFASELTEAEVEQAVADHGKETVTGNVFIWFLCAIAFLKVSQKIDSFMASLGINVGNTGGNMMAELLIAGRSLAGAMHLKGGGSGGGGSSGDGGYRKSGSPGSYSPESGQITQIRYSNTSSDSPSRSLSDAFAGMS